MKNVKRMKSERYYIMNITLHRSITGLSQPLLNT